MFTLLGPEANHIKIIQLTRGKSTIIDDDDYEKVSKFNRSIIHTHEDGDMTGARVNLRRSF